MDVGTQLRKSVRYGIAEVAVFLCPGKLRNNFRSQKRRKPQCHSLLLVRKLRQHRFFYEDHGSGKPVVLIPRLALRRASWEKADRSSAGCGSSASSPTTAGDSAVQPALDRATNYKHPSPKTCAKLVTKLNLRDFALVRLLDVRGGEVRP